MQSHPLEIIYRSVVESEGEEPPTSDFVFGFVYPSRNFSSLVGTPFETEVVWKEDERSIIASTAIEGIEFRHWGGIEDFLARLNRDVQPYLTGIHAGSLAAVFFERSKYRLAPAYQFKISSVPKKGAAEIGDVFNQLLFDRAALVLWLTRTIFAYIAATGEVPDAAECQRLLSLEYGRFVMGLTTQADMQSFPPGLYENAYGRGLDRVQ